MSSFAKASEFDAGITEYVRKIAAGVVNKSEVLERGRTFQEEHREFRRLAFIDRKILENCLSLLEMLNRQEVRWDFVFEVSMNQTDRLTEIKRLLPSVIRDLNNLRDRRNQRASTELGERIDSTRIRTCHLCRWLVSEPPCCDWPFDEEIRNAHLRYVTAKRNLAQTCLMLVIKIAHQYRNSGSSLMELVQDGNVGVMIAAEKYDPMLGWTFSSYASHWIRRAIVLGLGQRDFFHVPDGKSAQARRCRLEIADMVQTLGRNSSVEEKEKLLSANRISELPFLACRTSVISFDQLRLKDDSPPVSFASKCCLDCPVNSLQRKEVKNAIANAMESLTTREQRILAMRYGLNGEMEQSLPQIARRIGLSHQRIQQILSGLQNILRDHLEAFR